MFVRFIPAGVGEDEYAWSMMWLEIDEWKFDEGEPNASILKGRWTKVENKMLKYYPKGKDKVNVKDLSKDLANGHVLFTIPCTGIHMARASGIFRNEMHESAIHVFDVKEEAFQKDSSGLGLDALENCDADPEDAACAACNGRARRCQMCRLYFHEGCFNEICEFDDPADAHANRVKTKTRQLLTGDDAKRVKVLLQNPPEWIDSSLLCPLCKLALD